MQAVVPMQLYAGSKNLLRIESKVISDIKQTALRGLQSYSSMYRRKGSRRLWPAWPKAAGSRAHRSNRCGTRHSSRSCRQARYKILSGVEGAIFITVSGRKNANLHSEQIGSLFMYLFAVDIRDYLISRGEPFIHTHASFFLSIRHSCPRNLQMTWPRSLHKRVLYAREWKLNQRPTF